MVNRFRQELQIKQDKLFPVRHVLQDPDVMPFEEIPVQLQPEVAFLIPCRHRLLPPPDPVSVHIPRLSSARKSSGGLSASIW